MDFLFKILIAFLCFGLFIRKLNKTGERLIKEEEEKKQAGQVPAPETVLPAGGTSVSGSSRTAGSVIPPAKPLVREEPSVARQAAARELAVAKKLAAAREQAKSTRREAAQPQQPAAGRDNRGVEYGIHSPEEARRAMIWSEILNRKY